MTVIWSGRDRSEKYPQAVLRGTQPPRRSRRVEMPKRPAAVWTWRPVAWAERADAWLWEHPVLHTVCVSVIVGSLLWALITLTLRVARMEP